MTVLDDIPERSTELSDIPISNSSTFRRVCKANPAAVIGYALVSTPMPKRPNHTIVLKLSLAICCNDARNDLAGLSAVLQSNCRYSDLC